MASQAAGRPPAPRAVPRESGNPFRKLGRFVGESAAELKKVEWPNQSQVVQGTVVVIVACVIVGTYLWLNDQVWKQFVAKVIVG